jgi:sec-independent protein translocase protein TatB
MLSLNPEKLLVVLIVALILLGPDKLPRLARQLGAGWRQLKEFQQRVEREVRETMPDLPPTHEIARIARSPARFLNSLAQLPEDEPLVPDPAAPPAPAAGAPANGTPPPGSLAAGPPGNGADPGSTRPAPIRVPDDPSMN